MLEIREETINFNKNFDEVTNIENNEIIIFIVNNFSILKNNVYNMHNVKTDNFEFRLIPYNIACELIEYVSNSDSEVKIDNIDNLISIITNKIKNKNSTKIK